MDRIKTGATGPVLAARQHRTDIRAVLLASIDRTGLQAIRRESQDCAAELRGRMDDAQLEELCASLASLRTQKDWRIKLQSCEQVATQLLNMPDRSDSQFDKLLATTINYLLLAQVPVWFSHVRHQMLCTGCFSMQQAALYLPVFS